eukprot:gnl/TRDRNA2_/TRDRNA2_155988_c2_seq2.p1 gnl/TRDRNA2_/TRDRNA2_155988_c2~~gnl/TRDRNA2_/TRDRNA2_155988_c2_seq2.p1  ORF type:complete len:299 (-),score=71.18 gnl/TRDRNA2_/TRDRNA2_155988_c2_seq2:36-815(-)
MGREDEAALFFMKMVEDLWDLGILLANRAFHGQRWKEFYQSRNIIAEALRMQKIAEPHELILRAKVLSNLGQCYLATGEHDDAEVYYSEAYQLFNDCVGKRSPLFGMQAWACANLRCAEGRYTEALPLLGEALYVEVVKDGLSISEMMKLADQSLGALHEAPPASELDSPTEPLLRALVTLIEDPRWWQLEESLDLAVLCHKFALIYVAARSNDSGARAAAVRYSQRAVDIFGRLKEATHWSTQAEAVHNALFAARARH